MCIFGKAGMKMYVVCGEHLEQAIDEFIEIYESPPDLYELKTLSLTEWETPSHCNFCERSPRYLVV